MVDTIQLKNKTLVVADDKMKAVVKEASAAGNSSSSVLLCGESGTGKELIARLIHEKSDRRDKPFIAVNCAAIPEGLMEAELFGFEKGAFTGALYQRIGKFELANGGTILLDEISEMPYALQAKLLRVLQEGEIDRIGARDPVTINARIIATSNKSPEELIFDGKFREDLYYRLNVIRINCPSLRFRKEAIDALTRFFLESKQKNITQSAMQVLLQHNYPGNIRELENIIERAVLKSNGDTVTDTDIRFEQLKSKAHGMPVGSTLAEVEKNFILSTLKSKEGNRTDTAKDLGISIRTLRNKLKEYRQE